MCISLSLIHLENKTVFLQSIRNPKRASIVSQSISPIKADFLCDVFISCHEIWYMMKSYFRASTVYKPEGRVLAMLLKCMGNGKLKTT